MRTSGPAGTPGRRTGEIRAPLRTGKERRIACTRRTASARTGSVQGSRHGPGAARAGDRGRQYVPAIEPVEKGVLRPVPHPAVPILMSRAPQQQGAGVRHVPCSRVAPELLFGALLLPRIVQLRCDRRFAAYAGSAAPALRPRSFRAAPPSQRPIAAAFARGYGAETPCFRSFSLDSERTHYPIEAFYTYS